METFPFKIFRFSTEYPVSGTRLQLGNSYQYDVPPSAPDQRLFLLKFNGMRYGSSHPELNMTAFEAFWLEHKLHKEFMFPHPVYGAVRVKFQDPLRIPNILPGGVLEEFEVRLIEIP